MRIILALVRSWWLRFVLTWVLLVAGYRAGSSVVLAGALILFVALAAEQWSSVLHERRQR